MSHPHASVLHPLARAIVCLALIAGATAWAPAAFAQTARDDALYQQLGGHAGLTALIDDLSLRLLEDPRTRPFFQDVDMADFKPKMVIQFCDLAGGPCQRKGKDMKTLHSGQDISRANFNAVVEVLQFSMDARGIPFSAQNRLLAKFGPMHRDIVNVP